MARQTLSGAVPGARAGSPKGQIPALFSCARKGICLVRREGLREILFRRGGKRLARPACSLSSLSIDGALSAVVICLASERGPRSCPAGGAFPSGQATPLASRRAALAKAGPFAYKTSHHGAWRSMVAHLLWEQGVAGSNPVAPTIHKNKRSAVTGWPLFVFSAAKICLRAQEQTCSASGQAGQCRICPAAAAGEERGDACIRRKAFGGKSRRDAASVRCAFRQKERAAGFAAGCPGS